jgi:hypothetical protein
VFLNEANLPSTRQWQEALDGLAVNVRLDESVDTTQHSGFWPVLMGGSQSGFEYYSGTLADAFGGEPPEGLGDREYVVNLVTHSDIRELQCAMFAAAALAIEVDGAVFDDDSGGLIDGAALVEQARAIVLPR